MSTFTEVRDNIATSLDRDAEMLMWLAGRPPHNVAIVDGRVVQTAVEQGPTDEQRAEYVARADAYRMLAARLRTMDEESGA